MADWITALEKEFGMAADARGRGNEGQARVCARRAAGVAIREYFHRKGLPIRSTSAYDMLKELLDMPDLPVEAVRAAGYLTLRVNEEFKLPAAVDLIREARVLAESLFPGEL